MSYIRTTIYKWLNGVLETVYEPSGQYVDRPPGIRCFFCGNVNCVPFTTADPSMSGRFFSQIRTWCSMCSRWGSMCISHMPSVCSSDDSRYFPTHQLSPDPIPPHQSAHNLLELAGRGDDAHVFRDFRSPSLAWRRDRNEKEKYGEFRSVTRGQLLAVRSTAVPPQPITTAAETDHLVSSARLPTGKRAKRTLYKLAQEDPFRSSTTAATSTESMGR
jgi:hypothetical protein